MERTLVIVKPDGVERGLVGRVLARFEATGLRIRQLEMRVPSREIVAAHYPSDDAWLRTVASKTLEDYAGKNIDPRSKLGTSDPLEIGRRVKGWLVDFMSSGPVVVVVLEGNRSIDAVRKLVGATLPVLAAPGTIRGDLSTDSPDLANDEQRPVRNLIHASGDPDEAEREIKLWFP